MEVNPKFQQAEKTLWPEREPSSSTEEGSPLRKRMTRDEALAKRKSEETSGVPFMLFKTGLEARVRDLPFADKTLLMGIPKSARPAINKGIQVSTEARKAGGGATIEQMIEVSVGEEQLANVICVAGFIYPRLVLTPEEVDESDPDCWPVDALHKDERIAYRDFVMRNRDKEREAARVARFPGSGVEETPTR